MNEALIGAISEGVSLVCLRVTFFIHFQIYQNMNILPRSQVVLGCNNSINHQIGKYRDQPGGITTLGVPQKYMKYLQKI